MPTVFVTGGAGFIGSHLVELLLASDYKVVVFDNLSTGFKSNLSAIPRLQKNFNFIKGDITDKQKLLRSMKGADFVVHLAAKTSVPESIENPEEYTFVNVLGTANVLETAKELNIKRVVLASSAAVYGNESSIPLKEEKIGEVRLSTYAISKYVNEVMGKYFSKQGFEVVSLRFFNVFGPRQDPKSDYAGVITKFIISAVNNKSLLIFGDGLQTRDFVYVGNIAAAIVSALTANNINSEIINLASGKSRTVKELAETVIRSTKSKSTISFCPKRDGDILHSGADISKAITLLDFKESISFEDALNKTFEYYKKVK